MKTHILNVYRQIFTALVDIGNGKYGKVTHPPSRDAHIKTQLRDLRKLAENLINRYRDNDPMIHYEGNNLAKDMHKAYLDGATHCNVTYKNSNKQPVKLNLLQLTKRAFDLSFDPYHCVELRWGAKEKGIRQLYQQ